ncbi:CRISPR-associated endoribonuclease Cas6 [Thomasclavelia spiroformis]|uniref:CRISPR-associated endoribonuclease Cas6 n=1 Tax=Thomasclavelia spiroformis TaxID=29348 RepID=UPI00320AEBA3
MRYKLYFKINKPMVLNLNYHLELQRFIYLMISNEDKEYANWLHDQGFGETKRYKLFCFSKLYCLKREIKDKKFIMDESFSFQISCVDDKLDEILLSSFNSKREYIFNNQKVTLDHYEVDIFKGGNKLKIKMLSPVVVKDGYIENSKRKTHYYNPLDKIFEEKINSNFKNKYYAYYHEIPEDIEFKTLSIKNKDKYITKYNDIYINGWHGLYELSGKQEYLKFLYYVGIGERNSQGFGMFEILEG